MKKRKFLKPSNEYICFEDLHNKDQILCITQEVFEQIQPIIAQFGHDIRKVPTEHNVPAFRLSKVDEDEQYEVLDITVFQPIDFPVYRISMIPIMSDSKYRK
jgi:hypothetical protein